MKIAIIGAGFAGLASCWHLSNQGHQCTVFDSGKEGASHVATGLLHPYIGKECKRSLYADDALEDARALLHQAQLEIDAPIADYSGIIRICPDLETAERLKKQLQYDDIEWKCPLSFLITSGITVFSTLYLKGLRLSCEKLNIDFITKEIFKLEELVDFDRVIIAVGRGIERWFDLKELKLDLLKGQALTAQLEDPPKVSIVGSGYIGRTSQKDLYCLGSTYERSFTSDDPDRNFAELEIFSKLKKIDPSVKNAKVQSCHSGVRVCPKGHYLPIVSQLDDRHFLFTGLGSRGLLYHGWASKQLLNILR